MTKILTPKMTQFLRYMAEADDGKGRPYGSQGRIASKAVSDGYGMILGIPGLMLFIINDDGRSACGRGRP